MNAQTYADQFEDTPTADETIAARLKRAERQNEKQFRYGCMVFTDRGNAAEHDWRVEIVRRIAK